MASHKPPASTATFLEHLKQALEAFGQPEWLGSHSPLAAPYFLGHAIRGAQATATGRGQALCTEIDRALETLWGGPLPHSGNALMADALAEGNQGGRYDCLILELNYFKQRFRPVPKSQSDIYNDILHISRPPTTAICARRWNGWGRFSCAAYGRLYAPKSRCSPHC